MIQDRLTALFRTTKTSDTRPAKAKPRAKVLAPKAPASDRYTKGRSLNGSFWI